MASGRTHESFNLALVGAAGGAGYALGLPDPALWGFVAGGLVGTFWVTPDLDLAGQARVRPLRYWGPLAVLWWPYGWVRRHRGVSHSWVVGPLERLLYLGLLAAGGLALLGVDLAAGWAALRPYAPGGLAGYLLAQWGHLLLDGQPLHLGLAKKK